MGRRIALCLVFLVMMVPAVWAESPDVPASGSCGEQALFAKPSAPRITVERASLEALNPLQGAKDQAVESNNLGCCTQQDLDACYASPAMFGEGCYVGYITCYYYNTCWCQIVCN